MSLTTSDFYNCYTRLLLSLSFFLSLLLNAFVCVMDDCNQLFCNMNFAKQNAKHIENSFFIVTVANWPIDAKTDKTNDRKNGPQSDNSDTSNTSIASASGSIGYGSRVVGSSICYQSSTEGPSPGETVLSPSGKESMLPVVTTSGSALIGLSDSDGGCINPAYDNGDGNCPIGTSAGSLQDGGTGEAIGAATCGESTASSTSNEISNPTCCLVSPSCPKNKSLSTSTSLKKKSSSFLHRERKKPVLTRSQVSTSFCGSFSILFLPCRCFYTYLLDEKLNAKVGHASIPFFLPLLGKDNKWE